MSEITPGEWEQFLANCPDAHILQTRQWGDLKSRFGWKANYIRATMPGLGATYGAQILFKKLPFGMSVAYIARGPVTCPQDALEAPEMDVFWAEVDRVCRRKRAVFLKLEPDAWETSSEPGSQGVGNLPPHDFISSPQNIQPIQTLLVDLRGSEDEILGRMRQKTRYNIRLAAKKGVSARTSVDLKSFYQLMQRTGERDSFGIHTLEYYQQAFNSFHPLDQCALLLADFEGKSLAGLMVFKRGNRAWYFYGASSDELRELMPTYLLQWEAMRWARQRGCLSYDLWGIPDAPEEQLEAEFLKRSSGLWGVYRFKRGFGGKVIRSAGPWDRVYQPALYRVYRWWSSRRTGELHAG
jgi:lipid II:glycine glycyltransferase (peptidoglycan interpeptide bridge formation enzyme)